METEDEARKFNVKNVKTALLNRELGDGRATDFKKAASRLVGYRLSWMKRKGLELLEGG